MVKSRSCTAKGSSNWRDLQFSRRLIDQLLQRAKRAEPATEHATAPEQNGGGCEGPEDEEDGIGRRNRPQRKSWNNAWTKVSTLTTESCPSAYQPRCGHGEQQVSTRSQCRKNGRQVNLSWKNRMVAGAAAAQAR